MFRTSIDMTQTDETSPHAITGVSHQRSSAHHTRWPRTRGGMSTTPASIYDTAYNQYPPSPTIATEAMTGHTGQSLDDLSFFEPSLETSGVDPPGRVVDTTYAQASGHDESSLSTTPTGRIRVVPEGQSQYQDPFHGEVESALAFSLPTTSGLWRDGHRGDAVQWNDVEAQSRRYLTTFLKKHGIRAGDAEDRKVRESLHSGLAGNGRFVACGKVFLCGLCDGKETVPGCGDILVRMEHHGSIRSKELSCRKCDARAATKAPGSVESREARPLEYPIGSGVDQAVSHSSPHMSVPDWASSDMPSMHETASSPIHFGYGTASQEIRTYAPMSVYLHSSEELSQQFVQEMIGMSAAAWKHAGPSAIGSEAPEAVIWTQVERRSKIFLLEWLQKVEATADEESEFLQRFSTGLKTDGNFTFKGQGFRCSRCAKCKRILARLGYWAMSGRYATIPCAHCARNRKDREKRLSEKTLRQDKASSGAGQGSPM
ncbi:hypothetical protein FFLO_00292 [Filobasidium floriforme]|uniref:Uncharacterized protein n=1 Tax=Filobasidium floriforme TaxID=5210 RepID=A0A8K0JSQ2_9TREE|nr:uncharacterized protein HD553DRAFT_324896 [Filobasidium floriforme]KAG7575473.1 hypothetical protein FFLO_00292 [Filobasidium floriforme]KAH8082610.1 hypothetical protein HD553DRAFT_324896 [Filobasidium floriforme]